MFKGENAFSTVPCVHSKCSVNSSYDVLSTRPQARRYENTGEAGAVLWKPYILTGKELLGKKDWRMLHGEAEYYSAFGHSTKIYGTAAKVQDGRYFNNS